MRPSRLAVALLATALLAPAAAAQTDLIALDRVGDLLAAKQPRAASRELRLVSVDLRNEIGRCRDESLGAQLMALEPKFDALAKGIDAGSISAPAQLAPEFAVIDRLLAQNHQQLAATGWGLRRFGRLEGVANDLEVAARYLERSARWSGTPLAAEAQQAVKDALTTATQLRADLANPPAQTGAVIEALGKVLKPTG